MKTILVVIAIILMVPSLLIAEAGDHKVFRQLAALLELTEDEKKKMAVAFVTLEENMAAMSSQVGKEDFDALDLIDNFYTTRVTFRESVTKILSQDQINTMEIYAPAIFYELANDVSTVAVKQYKDPLNLSDTQMDALILVVHDDLRNIVATCYEYNEKDFNKAVAESMKNDVLEIRKQTRTSIKKILTGDQWTKLQKM